MKRLEFPRKIRAAIIKRASGRCEQCSATLKPGEGEVDHILPCALGGDATIANGRLICKVCHAEKTADDIRRTRKADRSRDKASGAVRPSSKLSARNRPKPGKAATKRPLPPVALFKPIEDQSHA